jgi:hypothetical protein
MSEGTLLFLIHAHAHANTHTPGHVAGGQEKGF